MTNLHNISSISSIKGGKVESKSIESNIIVDTLNVTYWLKKADNIVLNDILNTIDYYSAILRKKYTGKVIFVVKDKDYKYNDKSTRDLYQLSAVKNRVSIFIAEKYEDLPYSTERIGAVESHSTHGRDDFLMGLLANKYHSPVITFDNFADFHKFRSDIPPFHVTEYNHWKTLPEKMYVKPNSTAYSHLKRPRTIKPDTIISFQHH
jgi:hypothetical protein